MKIAFPPTLLKTVSFLALAVGAGAGDLLQEGQITLHPAEGPVVLTLKGPAYDSTATPPAAAPGLTLSYHDGAAANGIFRLHREAGAYQWQLSTAAGSDRLAMQLGNDHALKLISPSNAAHTIELRPGNTTDHGIFINGQPVLTRSAADASYLAQAPSGNVGIGTSTPAYPLVVKSGTAGFEFNAASQILGSTWGTGGGMYLNAGFATLGTGTEGAQIFLGGSGRGDNDRDSIVFLANGAERGRFDAAGHFAIGGPRLFLGKFIDPVLTTPGLEVHYVDGGYGWLMQKVNRWGSGWVWQRESPQGPTAQMYLDNWNGLYLFDGPAGQESMKVYLNPLGSSFLTGGNLGIGTTTPAKKLHVVGDVQVDGIIRTDREAGDISMGEFTHPAP